ncbi:MAG: trehalase family glycosidase [Henriciella sp.]
MKNPVPFDTSWVPEPVLDGDQELIDLYYLAWTQAWDHVKTQEGLPSSPYMDEAFWADTIWIWDTAFMVHFTKYASNRFPGIQSFDNFYETMHGPKDTPLFIQHADNPPLFAWIEYEYARVTGDKDRLKRIYSDKQFLQKHFDFFETSTLGLKFDYMGRYNYAEKHPLGYFWSGDASGMDNSPRGRGDQSNLLWLDAISQQALAAKYMSKIAALLGENASAHEAYLSDAKKIIDRYYWDEASGFYHDIRAKAPYSRVAVATPASYWPMLAGLASPNQAARLHEHAKDEDKFGGSMPWSSVARDDPDFEKDGRYWRGGIWLPTAYMSTKALQQYGYLDTANELAENLVRHMLKTYQSYDPKTIWECYSPTAPSPSTAKTPDEICRPDFCGWSALGPISMLIENVIGLYDINAMDRVVSWRLYRQNRHGIRQLTFGSIVTDLIYADGQIQVVSNAPYTLNVNGVNFDVAKGLTKISANPI